MYTRSQGSWKSSPLNQLTVLFTFAFVTAPLKPHHCFLKAWKPPDLLLIVDNHHQNLMCRILLHVYLGDRWASSTPGATNTQPPPSATPLPHCNHYPPIMQPVNYIFHRYYITQMPCNRAATHLNCTDSVRHTCWTCTCDILPQHTRPYSVITSCEHNTPVACVATGIWKQ